MTIFELYKNYTEIFRNNGFDSPDIEAAYILSEVTGMSHTVIPFTEKSIVPEAAEQAETFLKRRLQHEPYQYIFGWAEFRELRLSVGPGCLIPRPETEFLLDYVLPAIPRGGTVCELGAGSGAISLSVAFERKDVKVIATEISPDAFRWADKNRKDLGLTDRVDLRMGDLFAPCSGERFDVIAANLPYIDESAELPLNVKLYEPGQALFAPDRGFALIAKALEQAPDHLTPGGKLFFEIGEDQGARTLQTALRYFTKAEIRQDQYGVDRYLFACL
ncbi:MAG: peptide chain release factor N(5)-glutamine methyltransferase [Lentisphaeria bacterium]|nr:peptide chain release factor N(5)-glutamine methyltransferase [Lentisphaeria bacterium]